MKTVAQVRKRKKWLYKINFERKPTEPWDLGERRVIRGYTHIKTENGIIPEHRLIAEQKLGRKLESGEVVHHINRDKLDNNPDNLSIMSAYDHNLLHIS